MNSIKIILPCYNASSHIMDALNSIENQTFKDFDLFIIDDCSTDNTLELIEEFCKNSNIQTTIIKNVKNRGVSFSRNQGLKNNEHNYIAFIDSDDTWEKDKLLKQYQYIENLRDNDESICMTHTNINILSDDCITSEIRKSKYKINRISDWSENFNKTGRGKLDYKNLILHGNKICMSSVLLHKDAISFVDGFDHTLPMQIEDYLMWCQISLKYKIVCLPEKLTNYRVHKNSYTVNNLLTEGNLNSPTLIHNLINDRIRIFSNKKNIDLSKLSIEDTNKSTSDKKSFISRLRNNLLNISNINHYEKIGFKNFKNPESLDLEEIIIHVTDTCDLRCAHCFIDEFSSNHLGLEDFKKVLDSVGNVQHILLTGGEPFFNKEIVEIALYALERFSIQINTNGFKTEKIISSLKSILSHKFNGNIKINISLDGLEEFHDTIRKRKNSFQRATDTMRMIEEIRVNDSRIHLNVNTTLTENNSDQVLGLIDLIGSDFDVAYHNIEIVRGSPEADKYFKENKQFFIKTYQKILKRIRNYYPSDYETSKFRYTKQLDFVLNDKKWGYPCLAGQNNLVVYAKGEIAACEARSKILPLQEYDFNVDHALKDNRFSVETKDIVENKCCCPHGCWLQTSHSPTLREKYFFTDEQTALKYKTFWNVLLSVKLIYPFFLLLNSFSTLTSFSKRKLQTLLLKIN